VSPSIGIEELFRDFERPSGERIQNEPVIESSLGQSKIMHIEPSK